MNIGTGIEKVEDVIVRIIKLGELRNACSREPINQPLVVSESSTTGPVTQRRYGRSR